MDSTKINEEPVIEDIDKYEKLSQEELKKKALDELKIDEEHLLEETEKKSLLSKKTSDAIANLELFAEKLENTMRGKTLVKSTHGEEFYKQVGKAIAGESFIKQVAGIVKTFCNKPMLLSGKQDKEFFMQFEDAFYTISDMCLERRHNLDVIAVRSILKEVKDTFWNIGNIIMRTGKNMDAYFGKLEEFNTNPSMDNSGLAD